MFVVVVREMDGRIKTYFMREVRLSPKNGGWIEGTQTTGDHLGVPVQQVMDVRPVPGT